MVYDRAVKVHLKPEWGSHIDSHRLDIRQAIQSHYETPPSILDLELRPQLNRGFVSVSHAPGLGGFLFADSPAGFDIERDDRVRPETVARSSTMEEYSSAPDPAALWCAKEAAFKFLANFNQPRSVFEVRVRFLNDREFQLANADVFAAPVGFGWIEKRQGFTLAFMVERNPPRDGE